MAFIRNNQKNLLIALAILLVGVLPLIFSGSPYLVLIGCYIIIYLIAVSGLDVLIGFSGQISMGHSAYYCLGAYISVILHDVTGIPVIFTMLIAAVVATVVGSIIAWPTTGLVAHFMSLATIAFGEIILQLVTVSPGGISGNARGLYTVPISLFGFQLNTYLRFFYFAFAVLLVALLIKSHLLHSRAGRAMLAIRENSHAADGMGVNVRFYKISAFAFSAFYTSFAGAMYAHLSRYICPDSYTRVMSVMFLTMLLFGGTSSMLGPILGVVAVTIMNEMLRTAAAYKMLAYGITLLFVIVVCPGGIMGIVDKVKHSFKKKPGTSEPAREGK